MSALEKIIAKILADADIQADIIIKEAKQKAAEILKTSQAKLEKQKNQFDETARLKHREIISRAESSDRQNRRRALLSARGEVIDEIISEAKTKIIKLPDKDYFDFMFRLFKKNAQPQDGVIRFASADYARIPDGFLDRCRQVFKDSSLKLTGDMDEIQNGFVIQYGNVLQNCSIDVIFESERQLLRDKAYAVLTYDL